LDDLARVDIGIRDGDQRSKVKDQIDIAHRIMNGRLVAKVAEHDVDPAEYVRGRKPQQPGVAPGCVADECANAGALGDQSLSEMAANEAAGTGDQHTPAAQHPGTGSHNMLP